MKKNLSSILMLFLTINCFSQDIGVDSKQNPIYSFYTFEDVRFSVDADKPISFSSSFYRFLTTFVKKAKYNNLQDNLNYKLIDRDKDAVAPVDNYQTIRGFYYTASILNSENQFLKFNSLNDFQPGASLKLGYQYSIYKWGESKRKFRRPTMGINGIGQFDNIKIYNPDDSTTKRVMPLTYGLDGNINIYPVVLEKFKMILALNASYMRTWNDEELINYKDVSNNVPVNNIIAFEESDGRYGQLNNNVDLWRYSLSLPFYVWYLNPVIYYSQYLPVNNTGYSKVGVFFNIMNKTFDIDDGELPSSIGIGWDFDIKKGNISAPNYFLKGTISFGDLK